jgi:dipeptidyl aminopeptidase/acylaminoacyl peptidase
MLYMNMVWWRGNKQRNSILPKGPLQVLPCVVMLSWLATASLYTTPAVGAERHPFGIKDYSALHGARALAISPDGKTILFVVSFDGEKGPTKHEWHLIDVSGDNQRKLELPEGFEPQGFLKDGVTLYGSYEVAKKGQLGMVPITSAKPTQIISLPNGMHGAALSPDGYRFAVLSDPRVPDPLAEVRHVVENDVAGLYVAGVNGTEGAWWCPELKDISEFAWSPDGMQLAVVTQFQKIGHHDVRSAIYVCTASGARRAAEINNAVAGIAWANGGKDLAFASTSTQVLTPDHLWTVAATGGAPADQTPTLPGSIANVSNDPQGKVWVEMHKGVSEEIYAYRDGKLTPAYGWPGGTVNAPPVRTGLASPAGALAFTVGDPGHASNVAVIRGGALQKITHEGDDTLAEVALGEVRVVNWTAKDGTHLEGILTLPANYQPGKKYPFLVLPHGGPEANDTLRFDTFSRMVAGLGYVVLQPEYRGSTGYGTEFLDSIYQHFGDRAYNDVDSATDFAIAQGWADPNRLAIFGWSAGGFMTSWTVTQTNRYKAAIEGAGITDWLSFIPTSDIGQVDYDMRFQEKDPAPFLAFSAVMFADRVTTPLLILHGEADQRVPMLQGREFFVLLAERGKTVRMVTYPGSPHFPRLAEQRRNVFQELSDWLAKYNPPN